MKRGTIRHPKTLDLAACLSLPAWGAIGILESLLDWTFEYARTGAIGKFSDHAIARGVGWDGDPAALVQGLIDAGWVDRCGEHRLVIHGLADHAPDTWKTLMKRQGLEFATVVEPVPDAGPVSVQDEYGTSTVLVPDEYEISPDKSVPSAPAPAPTSLRERGNRSLSLRSASRRLDDPPDFLVWWNAYPRKVARAAAVKAWRQVFASSPVPIARMVDAIAWQRQTGPWLEGNGKFIPHPATYLHGRRWDDEPTRTPGAFADSRTSGNAQVLAEALAELEGKHA